MVLERDQVALVAAGFWYRDDNGNPIREICLCCLESAIVMISFDKLHQRLLLHNNL